MPPNRRDFLRSATAAAALGTLGQSGLARATSRPGPSIEALRSPDGGGPRDTGYWDLVRAQYLLPDDRLFLNPATLGPQPRLVVDAVMDHTRRTAETHPPRTDWDALKGAVGKLLNADPDGLVFPRNTTEGMNFVANGLDLGPGDEVLTTDHEHVGGLSCWELLEARRGVELRRVRLPVPATTREEIVEAFRRALTPATRVLSISHLTFTNGTLLPVAELVDLCRAREVVCVVDGAHPPGLLRVDMEALGPPDFYASSPHKWLGAPQGTGLLWMHERWRERLWPTEASGGWDDLSLGAHRFNHLGTMDGSRLAGLEAAVGLHAVIGSDRVEARTRYLRRRLHEAMAALPGATVVSPAEEMLVAGMVSFELSDIDSLELQARLARAGNVRSRVVSEYDYGWMRLSPHIYNTEAEIDRVVELIEEVRA